MSNKLRKNFSLALEHALINTPVGHVFRFLFGQVWLVVVASCLFCIKRFVLLTKVLILWPATSWIFFILPSHQQREIGGTESAS